MLWGKRVSLKDWIEYDPSEVTKRWKRRLGFSLVKGNEDLEVEGLRADGQWEPVSDWLWDKQREAERLAEVMRRPLAAGGSAAEGRDLGAVVEEMRRASASCGRKPGVGEAAHHLMDHKGLTAGQGLFVLEGLGYEVVREQMAKYLNNGRRRAQREKEREGGRPCGFCRSA